MPELQKLVAAELTAPTDPRINAVASAIAGKHGSAALGVLFYGSCLREKQLDGRMLDFYLIVSDYRAAYAERWLGIANRLIPPNVFYFEHAGLVAKFAVLSEADFAHECSPDAWTVSTVARFAQPSRLVWSASAAESERIIAIIAKAVPTLLGWTVSVAPKNVPTIDLWKSAFSLTFGAELRAEQTGRSAQIVDNDPQRYERFADAAAIPDDVLGAKGAGWWRRKQRHGKFYSLARLAKASLTFTGGADYIAWKINRHAGTKISLKPWQKRHPLLAGVSLLPRLLKSGAVR